MIREFIYKYYVDPIIYGQPYTIVDTLTYALILIFSVYLVYRWLRRSGIKIDDAFTLATLPYLVLGGLLRVVEDTGMVPAPWHALLVTPLIFFVIFFYTLLVLVLSRSLEHRALISSYVKGYGAGGLLACGAVVVVLVYFGLTETTIALDVLVIILTMALVSSAVVWGALFYVARWTYVTDIFYRLLIFGHMLDASATSYGIDLHPLAYMEQHVVGSTLIEATGTAFVMFPLKLVVIVPAIYILELYKKEGNTELWHLIILAMIMVGLAPGIRDLVRMVLHV